MERGEGRGEGREGEEVGKGERRAGEREVRAGGG